MSTYEQTQAALHSLRVAQAADWVDCAIFWQSVAIGFASF